VVRVGVGGDDHLAGGQIEVHLANQLDDFIHRLDVADVDEDELAAAIDQIDIDPQAAASLVVHLDDMRKQILSGKHFIGHPKKRSEPFPS